MTVNTKKMKMTDLTLGNYLYSFEIILSITYHFLFFVELRSIYLDYIIIKLIQSFLYSHYHINTNKQISKTTHTQWLLPT